MTAPDNNDALKRKLTQITDALARRDNDGLLALLDDDGGDADWCDDRGQTLLHFAALRGDEDLCEALIFKKGFSTLVRNEGGDTPSRLAAIFGHENLARHLLEIEGTQRASQPPVKIESLAALRQQSGKGKDNIFYRYACSNQFAAVVDCAINKGESLTRDDLLTLGQKGESVALRLCQSGQLTTLLRAELWRDAQALDVLRAVRDSLPRIYRVQIDATGLLASAPSMTATGPEGSGLSGLAGQPAARKFKLGPK